MTDRPTAPQTPASDPLLASYRRAADLSGQPARPAAAVRERILAQAQARLQPQAEAAAAVGSGRPAANESRWKLRALASMMVVSLAGLLAWQVERTPDEPPPRSAPQAAARAEAPSPAKTVAPAANERVGPEATPAAPADAHADASAAVPPPAPTRSARTAPPSQPSTHRAAARQATQAPAPLASPHATADQAHGAAETQSPVPHEAAPPPPQPFALPAPAATAPGPHAEVAAAPAAPALSRGTLRDQRLTLDKHAEEGTATQAARSSASAVPPLSLWQAAAGGRPGDVRAALSAGARANARDPQGRTPLVLVASMGDGSERYAEVARALLAAGADPGLTDRQGLSAIDHARQRGQEALLGILTTPVR